MKGKIIILLLLIYVCPVFAGKPYIEFKIKNYNFGNIDFRRDSISIARFVFKNKGEGVLVVQNVETSCGCTTVDWTKCPLQENESGEIIVKFNNKGIKGFFIKRIFVKSNAENSITLLKIEGNVSP